MRRNLKKMLATVVAVATAFAVVATAAPEASAKKKDKAAEAAPEVDLDGTYHAYIGFQSASYTFRNAWEDGDYGFGTPEFDQVTGWGENNEEIVVDGTLNDVEIAGNGSYSVSVTGCDLSADETMNLIFLSTDIPMSDAITISNVALKIDGSTKETREEAFLDTDDGINYIKCLLVNQWNSELVPYTYVNPSDTMEISFDITGFNYDKAADETVDATDDSADAADDTSADTSSSSSNTSSEKSEDSESSFPIIPVVAVVVVVVVVVIVVVVKKKD